MRLNALAFALFCHATLTTAQETHVVTIHAVTFDGRKVSVSRLPPSALAGARDLKDGKLTAGIRYLRGQTVQPSPKFPCTFIEETEKIPRLFSSTYNLSDPRPQVVDVWLSKDVVTSQVARLTVEIRSATDEGLGAVVTLKDAGLGDLSYNLQFLPRKSFIVLTFSKDSRNPPYNGVAQASDLSRVVFLVIDYQ